MLKKDRKTLKSLVQFVTGHCTLRAHLFRMGAVTSPSCRACSEGGLEEEPFHIYEKCVKFTRLRHELQTIKCPIERTLAFIEHPEVQSLLEYSENNTND